jgi:hypothetical protein
MSPVRAFAAAPLGQAGQSINPIEKTACRRSGWRGWGLYPCGYYYGVYPYYHGHGPANGSYGYGYGYGPYWAGCGGPSFGGLARFDVIILGQFMSVPEVCAGGSAMWIHSRAVASDCAYGEPRLFALPVILQTFGKHRA